MTTGLGLAGARVLVTGGGTGIGRGIAEAFGAEGARVAVTYHRHEPDDALREACPGLVSVSNDATDEADTRDAVAQVVEALGGVDVLVNNVGGMVKRVAMGEMTYAHWREVMALNLDTMFLMTAAVLPHLADGGRIINVASLAGHNGGGAGAVAYATAKSGMFAFTRGLAKELAPRRITVNGLAPGFIDQTEFHATHTPAPEAATQIAGIPLGRAGVPADVAGPTLWLASPLASWVTGEIVDINGGAYFA
ncbi:MAG TPA: SDR family oxidoreductase [Propionibacteriaceae bacterium]|nr:SDR family oxidoreductase [Propionibacteriaceae bacterium]